MKRRSRTRYFKKRADKATKAYKEIKVATEFHERRLRLKDEDGTAILLKVLKNRDTMENIKE